MAKYVATHITIEGKKIQLPDPVDIDIDIDNDNDDITSVGSRYIVDWNGKKVHIPAKGEMGLFYSPEIGRTITDPAEIRIAEYATMPLDSWLKCIRIIQMPIFTSKQLRLITTP